MQRKLTVGTSDNPLEREADRIADQVLAIPADAPVSPTPPRIQRHSRQAIAQESTAPASVDRVLTGSGSPLDPLLRHDMEFRFHHDFSRVRVHTGGAAEQSAQEVNANAYATGHNIVFAAGRFAPATREGRRLIAHELAHVVQQTSGQAGSRSFIQRDGRPFVPDRALKNQEESEKSEKAEKAEKAEKERCDKLTDKKRRALRGGTPLTMAEEWDAFWCPDKAGVYCRYGSAVISVGLDVTGIALSATGLGLPVGVGLFLLSTANNVVSAKVCGTFERSAASEALGTVGLVASGLKTLGKGVAVADIALNLGPIIYEGLAEETPKSSLPVSPATTPSNPAAGKGRLSQSTRPPGR